MLKTIHIKLYPREQEIIEELKERGYPVAEVIRELIRAYGRDELPKEKGYSEAAKIRADLAKERKEKGAAFEAMTNEEYATKILRGKIKGDKVAFRVAGGQEIAFSLTTIKQYTLDNNEVVLIHNQLLDKTFVYPNNRPPTEEQYKAIWKGW